MDTTAHEPNQTKNPETQHSNSQAPAGDISNQETSKIENSETENSETTHFGFETVKTSEKKDKVAEVFHSVAHNYDVMNDLMSLGIHRLWKKVAIEHMHVQQGHNVLDIAGGTGDLTALMAPIVGDDGHIILSDINESMLNVGKSRLMDKGIFSNVSFQLADAQELPFEDAQFDSVIIGFGLRNVTDKQKALTEMYRVLKPGGRLLVLEFSKPTNPLLSKIYDKYSFSILPKLGEVIAKDADSYRYLAESIRMHPDQRTLDHMVQNAGFESTYYKNLTGGIVAMHIGLKAHQDNDQRFHLK